MSENQALRVRRLEILLALCWGTITESGAMRLLGLSRIEVRELLQREAEVGHRHWLNERDGRRER